MAKFNVGDRALVIGKPPEWQPGMIDLTGEIVTITEPLQKLCNSVSNRAAFVYPTDAPCIVIGSITCFEPHHLKPIDDDGEEISWEQVEEITGWKPRGVVHVETSS